MHVHVPLPGAAGAVRALLSEMEEGGVARDAWLYTAAISALRYATHTYIYCVYTNGNSTAARLRTTATFNDYLSNTTADTTTNKE